MAISEQRTEVSLDNMIKALQAGEEWFTNLLRVMSQVSSSDFERACDDIERYVNGSGGRVKTQALFSKFRGVRGPYMKEYLESLEKQGRLSTRGSKSYFYTSMYKEEK